MTTKSSKGKRDGVHAYEVQKIEVLDEQTPSTPNGLERATESLLPLAKVIKKLEKSYDPGKKILSASKEADNSQARFSLPEAGKLTDKEIALRDALVEKIGRAIGSENVITDWAEGQRVLDEDAERRAKIMGTTTRKRQETIGTAFEGKELSEQQRAVVDSFSGKKSKVSVTMKDKEGKTRNITFRQGNDKTAGVKHSVFGHCNTDKNGYTPEEVGLIPDIVSNGEREQKGEKVSYKYTDNSVSYTVTTERRKSGEEFFTNFFTNRKPTAVVNGTSNTAKQHAPQQSVSGAKVQNNSENGSADQPKFFRTENGEAYGFTLNGKIYIDPRIATAETPVHEYHHLWAEALEKSNPDAWTHLKSELYKDADLVSWVKERYPDLAGDENGLAHELFAKFGGKRGTERLREEQAKAEAENKDGIVGKARIIAMFDHLKNMLAKYWQMARDLFAGNNTRLNDMSANDFADMAMADLMHGTNPLDAANAKNKGGRNARSERSSRTGEDVEREAKANGTWLKAPNGAETNLEEKQWKDVRTDSFKGYFGDWERSYQKDSLMNAEPVSKLEAKKIIAREGQSFIDAVYELFEKQGGKANSPFGEVLLDKKGAKNDVKHGVGVEKNVSFASVKDVLEKGIIILPLDYYGTSGKKQKTGIVAAPIAIDGKRYICAVEVIANKENSRLYVHEVFTTEKLHENVVSNQVRGSKTASPHSQGAIAKLLQEIVNSKDNSSKVVDENGELLVVYHSSRHTGRRFHIFNDDKPIWFTPNEMYAHSFNKNGKPKQRYSVYLNARSICNIGIIDWAVSEKKLARLSELSGIPIFSLEEIASKYDAKNIYHITNTPEFRNLMIQLGYDGLEASEGRTTSFAVFSSNQIKSATDNVGTFDRSNKDIRFSLPEEDRKVSSAHDAMSRKGLREIVGEEGYDAFLDDVGRRLRDEVKGEVSSSVGREFLGDVLGVATNAQHTERSGKSYEARRRDAVGLTIGLLLERIW